jgi:hypothetical protein
MGMPEPGSKEYDEMVDFMRKDLESGMQLTNIEMIARDIVKARGGDFDKEYAEWLKKQERRQYQIPTLTVICCGCKKALGTKECEPELDSMISHGLCKECAKKLYPDFVD